MTTYVISFTVMAWLAYIQHVHSTYCCSGPCKDVAWLYDDVIKWKHFPRYWPFVRGIHRSTANSPHKGQWRGALMFSLICAWTNGLERIVKGCPGSCLIYWLRNWSSINLINPLTWASICIFSFIILLWPGKGSTLSQILTQCWLNHQRCSVGFTWEQFQKCSLIKSVTCARRLYF